MTPDHHSLPEDRTPRPEPAVSPISSTSGSGKEHPHGAPQFVKAEHTVIENGLLYHLYTAGNSILTPQTFSYEINYAVEEDLRCVLKTNPHLSAEEERAYVRHSIEQLVDRAITAFNGRAPLIRHGVAHDAHRTAMISHSPEKGLVICGIYYRLSHTSFISTSD